MKLPVISFCDLTGNMVRPWLDAGYECWIIDIQTDNTSKKTGLWTGNGFVFPEKRPAPEPHRHDCHETPPSEDRADIRSMTPMGFARAVFLANARVLQPDLN